MRTPHQGRSSETLPPYGARMARITDLLRSLGPSRATENARAELASAHEQHLRAAVVARRVNRIAPVGHRTDPGNDRAA